MTAVTLEKHLAHLYDTGASRDHLLKDGMRVLNAAEVAYLLNFRDYRNAYREGIPKARRGWLAKDVRKHIENGRVSPQVRTKPAVNVGRRAVPSKSAPLWGDPAA